ncbi:uncharacterized protein A1O9_07937 [Exophiala aquamarina CBS 119918]|uniref:Uncharacterized protein n=1 Tax=Exophiala aquamarina CBS 119918 TaxID=1182545 RepID=A0A072P929_9EURO|nr:uncharacterized protein A1O9_07937 [Exophiala aquamarina CBS 119918]KEF56356.1 hypothetical protein A1O9_07937 [Exophiala aquamarina CBS 119918]
MAGTAHFYPQNHPHAHSHPQSSDIPSYDAPPSPTLTNPDMILPYNPFLSSSPTPLASSPTLQQSTLPPRPDSAVSLSSALGDAELSPEVGVATTVRAPARIVPSINTNFNGYEHGAPLSDIGEEETPVSKRSSRFSYTSTISGPSSPTPAEKTPVQSRRLSNQSSSSNGSDLGNWEDFDSSKMMNERLAADVAKVEDDEVDDPDSKRNSTTVAGPVDEMALLNERAERILEHARKRLTSMEDNLSKARHSILMSPRSSPNMSELHQPAGGLYRSISLAGISSRKSRPLYPVVKTNSAIHTRGGSDTTPNTGLKRLSMIPERSASALEYGRRQESPQQYQMSPSNRVAGFSPASSRSFNSPLRVLQEEEGTPSTIKTSPEQNAPRGLGINTLAAISKETVSVITSSPTTAVARSSSAMSSRSTKEIRDQMTDLRARISDLKDKAQADSMRRRSAQSMRTPSPFTAAQTPEQWYTSAPEYREGGSPINTNAGMGWSPSRQQAIMLDAQAAPVTPQTQTFLTIEQPTTNDSRLVSDARTDKNTPSFHKSIPMSALTRDKPKSTMQESHYEDAAQELDDEDAVAASEEEQVYLNEVLQESLEEIEPEVPEVPEHLLNDGGAGRHEDRLDAFDYENMFLHSAMGNYTGSGTRSLTPSESDGSSVVTTRMDQNTPTDDKDDEEEVVADEVDGSSTEGGAATPVQESFPQLSQGEGAALYLKKPAQPWMKAARSNSMDSVSTAATFATATEGEEDEVEGSEDEMPNEILHWGNGARFPQPPISPRREKTPLNWPTPPLGGRVHQGQAKSSRNPQSLGTIVTNGLPTPPVHSPHGSFSAANGVAKQQQPVVNGQQVDHPANTEILMESLIKLADPDFQVGGDQGSMTFSDVDKDLVLDLLRAVGGVCNQILQSENKQEVRAVKVLRRRLDESRQLLEGPGDD